MFCKYLSQDGFILKGSLVAPVYVKTASEDIAVIYQTVQLHPFYCLCVLRMSAITAVISEPRI